MTAVHLVPSDSSHEIVTVLAGLLHAAESGHLTGLVFGAHLRGQKYIVDAAGSLHRNTVAGIGVSAMLMAELEHRIRREASDTMM